MRPSSSPSDPDPAPPEPASAAGLFDGVLAAGGARAAVADRAWIDAMLEVEAALARAGARVGRLPAEAADAVTDAVARARAAARPDPGELGSAAVASGNPVVPLVRWLRGSVGPAAAHAVHQGATSQDILDTAAMLVARRASGAVLADLAAAAEAAARLAESHRDTPVAARTLLQQALPTTFGLVAAGWLTALDEAAARLRHVREHRLAVQLGGAAGTLAAFGDDGPAMVTALAADLGLAEPLLPWHTDRTRVAELAGALGVVAGVTGKIAKDIILYAQTEVGEVREGSGGQGSGGQGSGGQGSGGQADRGGSSTLPHKHNPVAAVSAAAGAAQAPGLVATLLAVMPQEHQRAAGGWHAEWRTLTALLTTTGSAAYWIADCLGRLRVDAARMRANLDATGGALLTERVAAALRDRGEPDAAPLVRSALARTALARTGPARTGATVAEALGAEARIAALLSAEEIESLLNPTTYLGAAQTLTARALTAHSNAVIKGNTARHAGGAAVDPLITAARRRPGRAVEVAYRVDQAGPRGAPAVLMVNSLGSNTDMWSPQVAALAGPFRVIRFDLRGHGRSPVPPGPYDLADLGADALALLDRLGVRRAHVCGLSIGGMVGLWLAAHAPERVDRLVVCCTSARLEPARMWAERARTVLAEGTAAVADAVVGRWLTPAYADRDPTLVRDLRAMIAATPAAGYAACCGVLERADLRSDLAAIVAPTLVIAAADDPAIPPEHGERVAAGIPGARLRVLADAAHLANVERAAEVNALLLAHLRGEPA